MPAGRPATRQRVVQNENDENTANTRLTRAKAAAGGPEDLGKTGKTALQTKKSTANVAGQRKRAALGDVSNVNKTEAQKAAGGKSLKAAQPTGVQKPAARPASRAATAAKDPKKVEIKKSGAGAISAVQKRKVLSATTHSREPSVTVDEAEPVRKKAHTMDAEKRIRSESKADKENEAVASAKADAIAEAKETALHQQIRNLDDEDHDDPLMVAEYANDIFDYLRELEAPSMPNPDYMASQDNLEWQTRGILVDWLIEVHARFHLLPETLFLAVSIIDRFLSVKIVQLDRFQLVGITAMFIASKYEEVLSPIVRDFRHVADDGYTEAEILSAERSILTALNYDLSYPNPMNFLRRVSKADNYDIQSRTIGKYLMEISLLDHRFMEFCPSHVSAGAMFLSRLMLDRGEWDATIAYYAGYTEAEVMPVVMLMVDYLARPVCQEAFFKKYASKKFLKASIVARRWAKENAEAFGLTNLRQQPLYIMNIDDAADAEGS
ncbi:G2/mitotic-specific cyclin-B-like protein [Emericellopsis cladophorae]|uniref:G2/mitotic-specific cyclin-B-like protein n=1 Tax=Emericellopsis cladophorae TaxID=2686198 RepID=A0A9Q0BIN8_9HYPO|nr:G2/mitotic-specific cyclin-B-like protein [Emericellopsis cladophorae]KAI6785854.1 G2/mitotic-specific cyclin-B-like protein [Emericellopsis cladophorae]